jgi:magnesium chelatase subunit D
LTPAERSSEEDAAPVDRASRWDDAVLAAALLAIDPLLGGASLRALAGPVRDRWLRLLRGLLDEAAPWRRLPLHAADDRLLGGLDLAATLASGRPVASRGLLAEADGGVVLAAMAERMEAGTAAKLASVLDAGEAAMERDGLADRAPARIAVVALDEGGPDERPPAALLERLAFRVDLAEVGLADAVRPPIGPDDVEAARELLPSVEAGEDLLEALCGTMLALGVGSARAALMALRAARAMAALDGRDAATQEDAATAARLVLAPRATRLPQPPSEAEREAPAPDQPDDAGQDDSRSQHRKDDGDGQELGEMVLEAARAAIPAGLLAGLLLVPAGAPRASSPGGAGALKTSALRGRPVGVRRGDLRGGARLNLLATLRAAAPWQRLRGRDGRVEVRPDDFRVTRFQQRRETTTIFAVDASGSAALNRLAEAKGAVELVLADCYVRRDKVALLAFRGAAAELLLPPTGSLARAKRCLAALPGGGATPLAAALDAAARLADQVKRRGGTPVIVLLSDGRANVARDGAQGRAGAEADARAAARSLRAERIACLLVDTSPRPTPSGRALAAEMGARYLPLPYADAGALSKAIAKAAA